MGFPLHSGDNAAVRNPRAHRRLHLAYERRVQLFAFLITLPGFTAVGILLWLQDWSAAPKLATLVLLFAVYWLLISALHEHVARPLQTLANVVAALREEDYSFRVRDAAANDAFGGLSAEVNELADLLSSQRSRAIEATALLRRVVKEIEAPLFAFDPGHVLVLVNPAGERLLQRGSAGLLGSTAEECGLSHLLIAANESVITLLPGGSSPRWLLRRSAFRQEGIPHTLIVLSNISRVLREQEQTAWQRLLRVLGHELNNSLTPIKSIAGTLRERVAGISLDSEQKQDFTRGLEIIESRAGSLNRFVEAYRHLAQMPRPTLRPTPLAPLLRRVALLEIRLPVTVAPGPEITLNMDTDQIEQMLINLVRNGAEAALEAACGNPSSVAGAKVSASASPQGSPSPSQSVEDSHQAASPEVCLRWKSDGDHVIIEIEDNGPGLANPTNAFVPFYTTKAGGSGIGLVFSRQIAEAHGGTVELFNRDDKQGCRVQVLLPVGFSQK
jgi:nitrogen fixation/metabolism regulation signal transduction histidine kinase